MKQIYRIPTLTVEIGLETDLLTLSLSEGAGLEFDLDQQTFH